LGPVCVCKVAQVGSVCDDRKGDGFDVIGRSIEFAISFQLTLEPKF
jgi:hypothetical protein